MKLMSSAETELHKLQQLDEEKSEQFRIKFEEMNNKVNRVTVLRGLTPVFDMPYPVTLMSKAGAGFLISNENPNSLAMYSDNKLTNLFMLNKTDGDIRGIAHVSGAGNFVATSNKIYRANPSSKEFEQMAYMSNSDLLGLKFVDPNRVYSLDRSTGQVTRLTVGSNSFSGQTTILKQSVDLAQARDLAVDSDVYVLFPDRLAKFTGGQQTDFQLSPVSEALRGMTKLRVGNQVYLLEPVSKRVLIYSRAGQLLNQVQFPELTELNDLFVDENARELYLINGNKVYKITF
jgi:hypothetical protein